jgi:hypothetical protein
MRHALSILLFALVAGAASAQTVPVRSGEHGAFTRLALDLPANTSWRVETIGRSVRIAFERDGLEFNTRRVFDRIDRARVGAIRVDPEDGDMVIDLACDCAAEAFTYGESMLVVDIAPRPEGAPPLDPEPTVGLARLGTMGLDMPPATTRATIRLVDRFGAPQIAFVPPGVTSPEAELPQPRTPASRADLSDDIANVRIDTDLAPQTAPQTAGALRAAVRASAVSGLLDVSEDALREERAAAAPPVSESDPLSPATPSTRRTETEEGFRLSVDTCVPDDRLIPAAADAPGIKTLIETRGAIFTELDAVNPDALGTHRAALLALGFGAEARALERLTGVPTDPVAHALSFLVDGEPDPNRFFAGQLGCEGQAALWALLTWAEDPTVPMVEADTVLRHGQSLPKALRRHLGPRLATALHRAGHSGAAEDLLAQLSRAQAASAGDLMLASAGIALDLGEGDTAEAMLARVELDDPSLRPALVLARIDTAFANGRPVAADTLDVAELTYRERREIAQGDLFWRGYMRALLSTGAFDAAVSVFREVPPTVREDVFAAARRDLAGRLVSEASDVVFLKHAVGADIDALAPRDPALSRAFAERLIDLGLPENALAQLDRISPAGGESTAVTEAGVFLSPAGEIADRILRARALAELDRLAEAEDMLAGLTEPEAISLRAALLERRGAFQEARSDFALIEDTASAARAAWLDGEWSSVAELGDVFGEAASLVQDSPALPGPDERLDPALGRLESMVERSEETRRTLDALLGETALGSF